MAYRKPWTRNVSDWKPTMDLRFVEREGPGIMIAGVYGPYRERNFVRVLQQKWERRFDGGEECEWRDVPFVRSPPQSEGRSDKA